MPEPPPPVRPATPEDVPAIYRMVRDLADYEKLTHDVASTEADIRAALFGDHPVAEAIVAGSGQSTVAFALFYTTFSTFVGRPGIHLEDVYVDPSFRGQGLGRRLLHTVASIARQRGCGRVEWTVLDWNQPAIDFYGSLGARVRREWLLTRLDRDAIDAFVAGG